VGQAAAFSAGFAGTPTPTIQWQVASSGGSFTNIPGATSGTLTLNAVPASANGNQYRAIGTSTLGSAISNAATLTVLGNALEAGRTLNAGEYLTAQDNEFQLAMQSDGNLVLYNRFGRALWSSNTAGNPGAYLVNQPSDGNLVVYGTDGQPLWATYTEGDRGDALRLENNGNLLVTSPSDRVLWQTGALDHSLFGGESLSGAASEVLISPNQQFQLAMQDDGNLVLYNDFGRALWASHTEGNPGAYLATQSSDGNVVIYSSSGQALWNAGTQGNPGDALQLQDDGNIVVYSAGGQAVWSTSSLQSSLLDGESLAGSWSQYLTAPNREYQFVMQADGNLVLYNNSGHPLWNSNTAGNPGAYLAMQPDGNLVVYSLSGQPLWSSGTAGNPGDDVQVQSDGNVVIYSSGSTALWATNTSTGGGGGGIVRKTGASLSFNPFAGIYSGECTYWADHEFGQFTGGVYLNVRGNAYEWADEAQAGGWTVTATPEVDSVVVFPPGEDGAFGDGHVAWVEQVSGSKIYVSEMNVVAKGVEDHNWYTVTPNLRFILAP
jgi:surface antigen